jgi:hypothetical protein
MLWTSPELQTVIQLRSIKRVLDSTTKDKSTQSVEGSMMSRRTEDDGLRSAQSRNLENLTVVPDWNHCSLGES